MTTARDPSNDQWEIRQVIEGYAAAVDQKDATTAAALFAADGRFEMWLDPTSTAPSGSYQGPAQIIEALGQLDRFPHTQHLIGSVAVTVDGDTAQGTSQCTAHHVEPVGDGWTDRVLYITYVEQLARIDGRWRFSRRELRLRWTSTLPVELAQLP